MLNLDDPKWGELTDAYGSASKIPELLKQLLQNTGPRLSVDDEPWFTLWSSLCHQGDVYTASYAAAPHIVEMALKNDSAIDFSFLLLPVSIEIARASGHGPELPEGMSDDYHNALKRLPDIVVKQLKNEWDESTTMSASAALAIAKGHIGLADKFISSED